MSNTIPILPINNVPYAADRAISNAQGLSTQLHHQVHTPIYSHCYADVLSKLVFKPSRLPAPFVAVTDFIL